MGIPKVPNKNFPDPDKFNEEREWNKNIRSTILLLRTVIGNNGGLESELVNSLKYINYTLMNAQAVKDELAVRQVHAKKELCKARSKDSCLIFLVYKLIKAWHECHLTGSSVRSLSKEFLSLFNKVKSIATRGLGIVMLVGNELDGYEFEGK